MTWPQTMIAGGTQVLSLRGLPGAGERRPGSGEGRKISGHIHLPRRKGAMGDETEEERYREDEAEERRTTQRRNMNHTTITGEEENAGARPPARASGEGGRGTALVGGAPSQGHNLLSRAGGLDRGIHFLTLSAQITFFLGILQEVQLSRGSLPETDGWSVWRS